MSQFKSSPPVSWTHHSAQSVTEPSAGTEGKADQRAVCSRLPSRMQNYSNCSIECVLCGPPRTCGFLMAACAVQGSKMPKNARQRLRCAVVMRDECQTVWV